ncbi:MAG: hypothetical protein RR872_00520, partial [Mucinivorans sp.]
ADSISERKIDFKFFMQLQPYNRDGALGLISAGIGNRTVDYYNFVPEKYVEQYGPSGKQTRNSTYVYGAIEGRVPTLRSM